MPQFIYLFCKTCKTVLHGSVQKKTMLGAKKQAQQCKRSELESSLEVFTFSQFSQVWMEEETVRGGREGIR